MIERYKTAIKRYKLSRPVFLLTENNLLNASTTFLDYGCGHGHDIEILKKNGFTTLSRYDPYFYPNDNPIESDVVNLGYVINVIEKPSERSETLLKAFSLCKKVLCVSVMIKSTYRGVNSNSYGDGTITQLKTFQKYFEQSEIKNYLESILQKDAIALEPGIFIVFKDEKYKLEFLNTKSSRYLTYLNNGLDREVSLNRIPSYTRAKNNQIQKLVNLDDFKKLLSLTEGLGRLPISSESKLANDLMLVSSLSKRMIDSIIMNCVDEEIYLNARAERIEQTLIFLALRRFDRNGFPKKKDLPLVLEQDIRAFFGSYAKALKFSTKLLFAISNKKVLTDCFSASDIGKLLPQALYIHFDYIHLIPAPLQLKVRIALSFMGSIDGCTIVKINRNSDKISFLLYQDFINNEHPELLCSYIVDLSMQTIASRDYSSSTNPPILHRKETFISKDDPNYEKFKKLTLQEEELGLLNSNQIGFKDNWEKLLKKNELRLQNHQVIREVTKT